ncbi:hypothetical protein GJ744_009608, partial [Endocarpon pusillum]
NSIKKVRKWHQTSDPLSQCIFINCIAVSNILPAPLSAQFNNKSSTLDAKVQVLGLFSRDADGNNNQMVMLTTEILRDIRHAIRSHTLSS